MLVRYERGETVSFGDLEVNQKGIYRPGGMVYWKQVGDIALEREKLSAYYSELADSQNEKGQAANPPAGKWHIWRRNALTAAPSWPNLPVFVALVNAILDQHGANGTGQAPSSQQPRTVKEIAALAKRKTRTSL